ncbi:pentapeptide repeat-containing protein [Kitasatospora sp. NPDC050463]|uniref:pentapeptide repeat-containing protein n=1 Tax=Kitasatospora sp. NPDC050463 TaxID=3155786 RepID=UPI0033F1808A
MAAVGALLFNALSVVSTNSQLDVARQGQVTDRFGKAVEQLDSTGLEIRLGGVYALERVMHDSPSDQSPIVEVLCGFIRHKAGAVRFANTTKSAEGVTPRQPDLDLLTALSVLAHRDHQRDQGTSLDHIDFSGMDLFEVDLHSADLHGADLRGANLIGSDRSAVTAAPPRPSQIRCGPWATAGAWPQTRNGGTGGPVPPFRHTRG